MTLLYHTVAENVYGLIVDQHRRLSEENIGRASGVTLFTKIIFPIVTCKKPPLIERGGFCRR